MKLTNVKLSVLVLSAFALSACMSTEALNTRILQIQQKHGVTVKAEDPLSRSYLLGSLPALLDRIDADLDKCPQYFKDNLGPVIIEESFAGRPETYPIPFMLRGYVDPKDEKGNFPIHIKNRSLLERLLLFAPKDDELFLHEATHSFEFNMRLKRAEYFSTFAEEFDEVQTSPYGGALSLAVLSFVPAAGYASPPSMASLYGSVSHWEDVAETHCYLRAHNGNVDFLKEKDPTLYKKCKIVDKFTRGETECTEPDEFLADTDW